MGNLERALPLVAAWGPQALGLLLGLVLVALWRLGRGRPLFFPSSWPARLVWLALVACWMVSSVCLYVLVGPWRPMLDQVRSVSNLVGRRAEDLAFRQVGDDRPRRLSELRDRVVLLNLWATWCPPCRHEMPAVDSLQRAYAGSGLVVVTLSNEDRARLLAYQAGHPLATLNVYTARLGWLSVDGRPLSLVIDRGGTVRELMIGARSYAELERTISKYLPLGA